jgi:hypothetical protein
MDINYTLNLSLGLFKSHFGFKSPFPIQTRCLDISLPCQVRRGQKNQICRKMFLVFDQNQVTFLDFLPLDLHHLPFPEDICRLIIRLPVLLVPFIVLDSFPRHT